MIRLHLLGRIAACDAEHSFGQRDLPGVQGSILFAYLLSERQPKPREVVADVIWNGEPPTGWNGALSSLTSKLRSLFCTLGLDRTVIGTGSGSIEIVLPHGVWVDREHATSGLDRARSLANLDDWAQVLPEATSAWSILKRPLLPGVDNPWVDDERRQLDRQRYEVCELLAQAWLHQGNPHLSFALAEAAISTDPLREGGYQAAILAATALGEAGLAQQIIRSCQDTFQRELGVSPLLPELF